MKLFIDTANVQLIQEWSATGLIDGITTNPTHLSKEGGKPLEVVKEICTLLPDADISVEITKKEPREVYEQAQQIAQIASNVVVKVPCAQEYYEIIRTLTHEGVKVNITLVFTPVQAILMAKLGVYIVSPFVGRWDDIGVDGSVLLAQVREVFDMYHVETQLLAASMRTVRDVHEALAIGSDIITVPENVLRKMTKHVLTQQGMEKFDTDWQKLGIREFP